MEKHRVNMYQKVKEKQQYVAKLKQVKYTVWREYKESIDFTMEELNEVSPFSYYNENIFSPEDFFLYRAVLNIYSS